MPSRWMINFSLSVSLVAISGAFCSAVDCDLQLVQLGPSTDDKAVQEMREHARGLHSRLQQHSSQGREMREHAKKLQTRLQRHADTSIWTAQAGHANVFRHRLGNHSVHEGVNAHLEIAQSSRGRYVERRWIVVLQKTATDSDCHKIFTALAGREYYQCHPDQQVEVPFVTGRCSEVELESVVCHHREVVDHVEEDMELHDGIVKAIPFEPTCE